MGRSSRVGPQPLAMPHLADMQGSYSQQLRVSHPEAAALCTAVQVSDVFMEHSLVTAFLAVPSALRPASVWAMSGEIPWQEADVPQWHSASQPLAPQASDSTTWYRQFASNFEDSLQGHVNAPGHRLPGVCRGRAKHTGPVLKAVPCVSVRASRPGEEQQRHDFLCSEVQLWFKQLRRLQSAVHALKAGKTATSAVVYRVSLWRSTVCARGFSAGFVDWWKNRPVKLVGSPLSFPSLIPSFVVCDILFQDFRCNYKALESWHIRHRTQVLAAQYSSVCDVLVKDLREPAPEQVDTLLIRKTFELEDADLQACCVRVASPVDLRGHSEWQLDGVPVPLTPRADGSLHVGSSVSFGLDSVLEQSQLLTDAADVISEFETLWTPRWGRHASDTEEEWSRITAFGRAFLPIQDTLRWRPSLVGSGFQLSNALSLGRPEARTHLPGRIFCTCLQSRSTTSWPFLVRLRPASVRGRTNFWSVRSSLCANRMVARIARFTDRSCFFQSFIGFGLAFGCAIRALAPCSGSAIATWSLTRDFTSCGLF